MSLPYPFVPSKQAAQQTVCAHPGGPLELFMVACNIETDFRLDERLAGTGYSPMLTPSPEPPVEQAVSQVKRADTGGEVKLEQYRQPKQYPFAVPLVKVEVRVKKEGEDIKGKREEDVVVKMEDA